MPEMTGKISKVEQKATDKGQQYYRVQVGSKWGSYWGDSALKIGDKVRAEYEEKKDGKFTNWKKFKPLAQEEKKEASKQSKSENQGKRQVRDARKRFEIRKQVALKAAVKTLENPALAEVEDAYSKYVNLLSLRPAEFDMKDEDSDENEDEEQEGDGQE